MTRKFLFRFYLLHMGNKQFENLESLIILKSAFSRQKYVRFAPQSPIFSRNWHVSSGLKHVNNFFGKFSGLNPFITIYQANEKQNKNFRVTYTLNNTLVFTVHEGIFV